MKSFFKWSAIVAGITMAVGIVFLLICTVLGGHKAYMISNSIKEGHLEELNQAIRMFNNLDIRIGNHHLQIGGYDGHHLPLTVNGTVIEADGNERGSTEGYLTKKVNSMDLTLGAGSFSIVEIPAKQAQGEEIRISVTGRGNCDFYIDETGTLVVEGFSGIGINDNSDNEIVLEIPENMSFDEIDIEAGAGRFELCGLDVNELSAEVGAGQLVLQDMTVGELSIDLGAGQTIAEEMTVRDANLNIGMGECIFWGSIDGNLEADCSMGNLELTLSGSMKEHNFQIECAAGTIDMDGFGMAALAGNRTIDNGADSDYELNCSMGNIRLVFEEK